MDLAKIEKMIAEYQPPPDPFNGATLLFLGTAAFNAIAAAMHPFDKRRISVECRPGLPPGYGLGFRPPRDGDADEQRIDGYGTLVWTLADKTI